MEKSNYREQLQKFREEKAISEGIIEMLQERFYDILKYKEPFRSKKLTELTNEIEKSFDIPLLTTQTIEEQKNSEIYTLYQRIVKSIEV